MTLQRFLSALWPIGKGPNIPAPPSTVVNTRGPSLSGGIMRLGGSMDLGARQEGRPPDGFHVPAPLPEWFAPEMSGADIHPEFSPFYQQRNNKVRIFFEAPPEPMGTNPLDVDVATHPFAFRSAPIDVQDQIPDGPTF